MTIYFVVLILCIVLAYAAEKNDCEHDNRLSANRVDHSHTTRNLFILLSIMLIVVTGFRYDVGGDYWSYYRAGERYSDELLNSLKSLSEPGIKLIYSIVRIFTTEKIVPIFVVAAITLSLMLRTIYRYTDKLMMAVLLFLFLGCWHESFNAVRQCMAAAIVFSGYGFLKDKKLFKYIIVIFIAFLFHRSAVLMILPYFIVHIKVSPKNILLIIIGVVVALYGFDRIIAITGFVLQEDTVLSSEYALRQVNPFRVAVAIVPAIYFIFITSGQERDETQEYFLNLLIVHAAVVTVTSPSAMLGRYGIYTAPFCVLAIPELNKLESAKFKFKSGYLFSGGFLICVFFFAYWVYSISKDPTINNYIWYFNHS